MPIPTLAEEPDGTLVQCPPQDPCPSFLGRQQLPRLISNPIAHPQILTLLERPLWKPQGLPALIYPTLPLNPIRMPSRPMTSLRNKKSLEELENARASKSKICLRPKLQLQSLSKKMIKQKETKNNMWAHTPQWTVFGHLLKIVYRNCWCALLLAMTKTRPLRSFCFATTHLNHSH